MINRHDVRNAMLDALERIGDKNLYYDVNHLPPEKTAELEEFLVQWLESIGMKFVI